MSEMFRMMSWDPGTARTGICLFECWPSERRANLVLKEIVYITEDDLELYQMLALCEGFKTIKHVVCENFRVRPVDSNPRSRGGRNSFDHFTWQEVPVVRQIGSIKYFAHRIGAKFTLQEPGILGMARRWCDFPMPKTTTGHVGDSTSAYIHGAHFMMNTLRMIDNVDEISKFGQGVIDDNPSKSYKHSRGQGFDTP